jgi:hypothetical protein
MHLIPVIMFARLFLFMLFITSIDLCLAQNCLDEVLSNKIYSTDDNIINGRKWIYKKIFLGTPLLMSEYWPSADIIYNGSHVKGQKMNYDLYKDEMIISQSENGRIIYVVINKDNLTGFSYTDTTDMRFHLFEYTELPGSRGKSLYENLSAGRIRFYLKPVKKVETKSIGGTRGLFTDYYEYYMTNGDQFTRISTKNQILELMPGHRPEIKRYMRDNRFKINSKHPENMIDIIHFLSTLN